MFRTLRSHAARHCVGYVALFFALAGTAYALPVNSVGPLQLRPFAVRNAHLGTLAVSYNKLGNDSVGSRNLRALTIHEARRDVQPFSNLAVQAFCPRGRAVVGAGTRWLRTNGHAYESGGVSIAYTRLVPLPGSQGVRVRGNNGTATQLRLVVQAFCLAP